MAPNRKKTELEIVEQYRISLENATTQPEIATRMSEYGYDAQKIGEGSKLHSGTVAAFGTQVKESDEAKMARAVLDSRFDEMVEKFRFDRKKAKAVFEKNAAIMSVLELSTSVPKLYLPCVQAMKMFYSKMSGDKSLQEQVLRMKLTEADIAAGLAGVAAVEDARAKYLTEIGESQDATKQKDAALASLETWMDEFYTVARIALYDKPQLLEVLGVFVRS